MYKILLGDSYEEIKKIESNSVNLIVTDPPYLIPNNQKRKKIEEGSKTNRQICKLTEELNDAGLTSGIDYCILDEFMRIMVKPNIYIWCNKLQIRDYLNYFVGRYQCKFDILVWIKSNPIPLYGGNYMNDKEYCLYFRKGVRLHTTYESGKTYWITPTNVKDKKLYGHPTVKPLHIIENMIKNSSVPGDTVADFFLGSGTTAEAAIKNSRNFLGAEKEERYYRIILDRIKYLN